MSYRSLLALSSNKGKHGENEGDGDDDEDSTADVADSLSPHTRRSATWSKRFGFTLQIYTAVVMTVFCTLLGTWLFMWHPDACILSAVVNPTRETLEYAYSRDLRYMSLDHKYDNLWKFANVSTLSVPEPELGTGESIDAAISMFHQLHCLSSLRTALQAAYEGHPVAFDWHTNGHWPHCLDYLRKTILCFADDTLELPKIVDGERTEIIDGANDMRKCKSNERLFMLQKSPQWRTGKLH